MATMVSAGTAAHAAAVKKNQLPETVTGGDGSAKRNIIRRGGPGRTRKEGLAGQMVDDGSTYEDPFFLDQEDPNYDSEEDDGREKIPGSFIAGRRQIGQSKLTLTAYKKAVQPVIKEYCASGDIGDVVTSLEVQNPLFMAYSSICYHYLYHYPGNWCARVLIRVCEAFGECCDRPGRC